MRRRPEATSGLQTEDQMHAEKIRDLLDIIKYADERATALAWENFLKKIGNGIPEDEARTYLEEKLQTLKDRSDIEVKAPLLGDPNYDKKQMTEYFLNKLKPEKAYLVQAGFIKTPTEEDKKVVIMSEHRANLEKYDAELNSYNFEEIKSNQNKKLKDIDDTITELRFRLQHLPPEINNQAIRDRLNAVRKNFSRLKINYDLTLEEFERDNKKRHYEINNGIEFKYSRWLAKQAKIFNTHSESIERLLDDLRIIDTKIKKYEDELAARDRN